MPLLPFGEWLPDQPDFANPGATTILNVVPVTKQSYGPMSGPSVYSGALNARCQGSYSMTDNSGNAYVFAGDANRLYLMKFGSTDFNDVSKSGGGPYNTQAIPIGFWSATSFGTRVVFANGVDPLQSFNVGTDTQFSDLSGNAPIAQYCVTIKDFLVVGNTFDSTDGTQPRRVWWPAIGDPTTWPTPGTNDAIEVQSDFQDLQQSDLGQMTGLVGGFLSSADGAAFMERGIYRINYVGSPDIFQFVVAQGAAGTQSPLSLVQRRLTTGGGNAVGVAYYLGEDDFYAFDGMTAVPIGAQKIAKTFFRDLDASYLGMVQGVADPINKLIFWAYHGPQNNGLYNRLLVWNWDLARWSLCDISATMPAEFMTRSLTVGYSLDTLDQTGFGLDTLPFSLDSRIWTNGKPALGLFNGDHKLIHTTGDNLPPTVETSETQFYPGRRSKILSARPLVDTDAGSVSAAVRDTLASSVTYNAAVPMNVIGECPQLTTGRYARFRFTLPAATSFTHLQGIDATCRQEGRR